MRTRRSRVWLAMALATLLPAAAARAEPDTVRVDAKASSDPFVFAAAGDLLGPYGTAFDPDAEGVRNVSALLRSADIVFANLEGNAFSLDDFKGSTAAENGGGYPRYELPVLRALRSMGINLVSRANNHATDFGIEGMFATSDALHTEDMTQAGVGPSLNDARAPAYRRTPKGQVALVAAASSFTAMAPAGGPMRGARARPGLNPLAVTPVTLVTPEESEVLRHIALRGGWQGRPLPEPGDREVYLGRAIFRTDDKPGSTFDVSVTDRNALIASVATARRSADFVAFSIHSHETESGGIDDLAPARFLPALFHDLIDAGADVVIRHGPHSVMGVEIYRGKPIFYGLGSLFFDLKKEMVIPSSAAVNSVLTLPDLWYEGAVAVTSFRAGKAEEIRLYPPMIGVGDGGARGLPRLAVEEDARRILRRIQEGSKPFGTTVAIENDVGIVRISSSDHSKAP